MSGIPGEQSSIERSHPSECDGPFSLRSLARDEFLLCNCDDGISRRPRQTVKPRLMEAFEPSGINPTLSQERLDGAKRNIPGILHYILLWFIPLAYYVLFLCKKNVEEV